MKKYTARIAIIGLIVAGIAVPVLLRADDSGANSPDTSTQNTPPMHKHARHGAHFQGKLDAVDTNAMTLTVGSQTFQVTPKTHITEKHQRVTLADAVLGENVSGFYRTNDDGNLVATAVHLGGHGKKKKERSDDSETSTNSQSGN